MTAQTENSRLRVSSPLGDDTFLLHTVNAREALCRPYCYKLDLYSREKTIPPDKMLGEPMTVHLALADGETRYYSGLVCRFERKGGSRSGYAGNYMRYEAVLVPAIWFLQKSADCRIFQEMTAPEIIKEIFRKHVFLKFDESLFGQYRKRNYCVQYRETDANFVHRLMEEEGMYYRFEHTDSDHTLVLCDSPSSHDPFPGYEEIEFYASSEEDDSERECVSNWQARYEVQTGIYAHTAYDFEVPTKALLKQKNISKAHSISDLEFFEFPGRYIEPADGETYARVRIEEQHAKYERLEGEGSARGLQVGSLFTLSKHEQEDQNREYLVVNMEHDLYEEMPFETGLPATEARLFNCRFDAIVSDVPYRPPCISEKPTVKGPQTAIVVGKSGEEIWTDEHGRVKVQFHWDRYGNFDENSSCWIRVSQVHAGKGFGGIDIPRIGEEVIVECLEGDPDYPMITGRVYNGDNKPPNGLPAAAMISGLKSNTTPGGGGDNTMMLDDTAGNEMIRIHGQYNMDTTVDNDQTNTVSNNRTTSIGVDDSESVGSNQTISIKADQSVDIGANRTETVGGTETITIAGARTETVNGGETVTVNGGRTHTVNGVQTTKISVAEMHNVGAGRMHNVGAGEMIDVGGVQMVNIGGAQTITVGGVQAITVGALQTFNVSGPHKLSAAVISETSKGPVTIKAGATTTIKSSGTTTIEAPTIVLKAGGSKIAMSSGGIIVKASKITLKADGNLTLNGSGGIKLKGPSIGEN